MTDYRDHHNENWLCPFCAMPAIQPTTRPTVCSSRTCACGAIGLVAPSHDADEIIDDAVNLFGVPLPKSGMMPNDERIELLRRAGIVTMKGEPEPAWALGKFTSLWFRRSDQAAS